jgi:Rrf2 family protein
MQLTRAADYAVRVMIHLASQPQDAVVPKAQLAIAVEAPESFLAKILQSLTRAGLIQARRGVEGGFSLLPGGAQASVLDVIEVIDGPLALNLCLIPGRGCQRQSHCAAHLVWVKAQAAMARVLHQAFIADLVSGRGSCDNLQSIAVGPATASKTGKTSQPQTKTKARQRRVIDRALRAKGKNPISSGV